MLVLAWVWRLFYLEDHILQRKLQGKGCLELTVRTAWVVLFLFGLTGLSLTPSSLLAAETRTVIPAEYLGASALHRWLAGSAYRELWTTPIEVEVLDLQTVAGGLRPAFRVGGLQTPGLAISGADGRSYTFRSLVKDLSESLPADFKGTFAADVVQDQLAAAHPVGPLIVPPLAAAAGVLHNVPRLVIMPDDPALGEFREVFAGRLGTFEEFPTPASDKHPGFHGATAILSTSKLWPRVVAGPEDRIDAREFLRARLFDVFIGDWDRHADQWRWAELPGKTHWQPIPEDRDWIFANYEGLLISLIRPFQPTLIPFREQYPSMTGLTLNGADLVRWVLPELEKRVWDEVAADLQNRLTDAVIDDAVRQMPRPYQALIGAELAATLKKRRDQLPEVAARFYRFLATEVDVQGTDQSERIEIRELGDSGVEVRIALKTSAETGVEPYFQRRFSPKETKELRLYLRQGADTVACSGRAGRKITIRVIGNTTNDVTEGCEATRMRFTDTEQLERSLQPLREKPDPTRPFPSVPTLPEPWAKPRDWGFRLLPVVWFNIGSDYGLLLGGGFLLDRFGFGTAPYAQRHFFRGGYAFGIDEFKVEYQGAFRFQDPALQASLEASVSGIEVIRFYGFGNDTSSDGSDDFFKTEQTQLTLAPGLRYTLTSQLDVFTGVQLRYATTNDDADTLLNQLRPYGVGDFGQLSFSGGFDFDTRDRTHIYGPGVRIRMQGTYFPEVWDVRSDFGAIEGELAGYLALSQRLLLVQRVSGKHVFGTFPFHEAAYVGGSRTVRGYRSDRFAGDASFFSNTELRFILGKAAFLVPAEWGLFAFGDVGRVFQEGESSKTWHPAGGGGIFTMLLDRSLLATLSVARSDEMTVFFLKTEFIF